jgi:signal transduction histidine kinase
VLVRDVVLVHDVTRERQVERLKADFIATVSHELRTPVTPIKGYADLLRRRGEAMTPERRNECLDVISDRCDHLVRLVEDLLLASRISATEGSAAAQVSLGTGDLAALVRRASGDFGADGSRLRMVLPAEPVVVRCDPVRVIQVLSNLLGNALKYSAAGTPWTCGSPWRVTRRRSRSPTSAAASPPTSSSRSSRSSTGSRTRCG